MAPPKKRTRCVSPSKVKCIPKKCPVPTPVPKLLIKGGVEVLNVITGPDSTTEIELYLEPRMGINSPSGDKKKWYGYSEVIHHADGAETNLLSIQQPQYSCARVQLPLLNTDMTCDTLMMWEAVTCKTEIVGIGSLINLHLLEAQNLGSNGPAQPIEGINFHMFAVGGEPLDLQGLEANADISHASAIPANTIHPNDIAKLPLEEKYALQGLVPKAKARLERDGFFPIEEWCPDPSRNENSRYFGSFVGGMQSPPTLQFTNSVTTVLLDENGVGPLCKGDGLFVSCADICGVMIKQDNGAARYRGLPRYFKVTLRKRAVKNPYPITSLLGSLFTGLMPKMQGQPMSGPNAQIEEVRIYQGKEGLPADPDMKRYVDQFGQEQTTVPTPAAPAAAAIESVLQEWRQKLPEGQIIKYGSTWPPYLFPGEKQESKVKSPQKTVQTEEIVEQNLVTEEYTTSPIPAPTLLSFGGTTDLKKLGGESGGLGASTVLGGTTNISQLPGQESS
ncbi:VP1 major capsid protein [Alphapolyomavirus chlopygerythrus]|uniref:VP1 major capsid protein n=1 Tax=Alphapolyomavirus chlopygerythrus TaxID=1891719 RepID=L0MZT2_9POLY|nr:VP1 major capsid protein [Alphapolyomavirus chlopygerythrus]BAM71868.1 VP1 major capsid protein [Alphapolyomavirus chlopygerythrus]